MCMSTALNLSSNFVYFVHRTNVTFSSSSAIAVHFLLLKFFVLKFIQNVGSGLCFVSIRIRTNFSHRIPNMCSKYPPQKHANTCALKARKKQCPNRLPVQVFSCFFSIQIEINNGFMDNWVINWQSWILTPIYLFTLG